MEPTMRRLKHWESYKKILKEEENSSWIQRRPVKPMLAVWDNKKN